MHPYYIRGGGRWVHPNILCLIFSTPSNVVSTSIKRWLATALATQWPNVFPFNSTAKIHPECTKSRLFELKSQKMGRVHSPSPDPSFTGEGTSPPHILLPSVPLAPRSSLLRRLTLAPSVLVPLISIRNCRHWCIVCYLRPSDQNMACPGRQGASTNYQFYHAVLASFV